MMDTTMVSQAIYRSNGHCDVLSHGSHTSPEESPLHYQSCNHGHSLVENILQLFRSGVLYDVVLVAGSTKIQAHQLVLAACSSYFRDLFNSCPPPPAHSGSKGDAGRSIPEFEITDVDGEAALKVIEFCYTAAISISEDNVWGILPVACMFQMEEVCQVCCDFLEERLCVGTCLPTLRIALKCSCQELQAKAANFIRKHFDELVGERDFQELPVSGMLEQLKCLQLDVVSDRQLVRGLRAWVNVQPDLRRHFAAQIASHFPDLVSQMQDFLPAEMFRPSYEDPMTTTSPSSKLDDSPPTSTTTTSDYSTDHEASIRSPICHFCGEVFANAEDFPAHIAECRKSMPSLPDSMMYPPSADRRMSPVAEPGGMTGSNGISSMAWLPCHVCGQSFPDQKSLLKHGRMHGEGGFACQICNKRCSTRSNLQNHMKLHGAAGQRAKLYQCEECGESFDSYSVLKVHRRSHTSVRPFPCPTCGVSFAKNIHLKRHLAIHTGVKPHQCHICQKFFSRSDHLKRHIQSIHSGAKPHSCHLCHKNFVRKYELNKHIRQHYDNTLPESGPSSPASSLANESYATGSPYAAGSPPENDTYASSPAGADAYPSGAGQITVKVEGGQG